MKSLSVKALLFLCIFVCKYSNAQELFIYTEPASNMPAKSIGIRLNNRLMDETTTASINYTFIPEVMWGVNKHLMLHLDGFFSNNTQPFSYNGLGVYAKYRFLSHDKVYYHFRMAAFGRLTRNNTPIQQEEIQTSGYNSGYQVGLIATQLLHKTAISSTVYYEHARNNTRSHEIPLENDNKALNYSLSIGRLIYPKTYKGFKQTNINLMIEMLGQSLPDNGKNYLDVAPAIQFIFNSQTRVDIGYKHELYSNMLRTSANAFLIRVEHLFFNIF